jgi:hypothetical protein
LIRISVTSLDMDEGLFTALKRKTLDVVIVRLFPLHYVFFDDIDYFVVVEKCYFIHCMIYTCMINIGC